MQTWLSVDCDFFFDGPADTTQAPDKKLSIDPDSFVSWLGQCPTLVQLGIDHSELLACWDEHEVRGIRCIHFDAHHDLFVDFNRGWELPLGVRGRHVGVGDHLFHALREGRVAELQWVLPPWLGEVEARRQVRGQLGEYLARAVHFQPHGRWRLPPIQRLDAFVCLSPEWTPRAQLNRFVSMVQAIGASADATESWRQRALRRYDALARGENPLVLRFAFGRGGPGVCP